MVSRKAFKLVYEGEKNDAEAGMEKTLTKPELRELLRRERLRSSHLRATLIGITLERDYLLRTVDMLRVKLFAVNGKMVSRRTFSNLERMVRRRLSGHRIKEVSRLISRKQRKG